MATKTSGTRRTTSKKPATRRPHAAEGRPHDAPDGTQDRARRPQDRAQNRARCPQRRHGTQDRDGPQVDRAEACAQKHGPQARGAQAGRPQDRRCPQACSKARSAEEDGSRKTSGSAREGRSTGHAAFGSAPDGATSAAPSSPDLRRLRQCAAAREPARREPVRTAASGDPGRRSRWFGWKPEPAALPAVLGEGRRQSLARPGRVDRQGPALPGSSPALRTLPALGR